LNQLDYTSAIEACDAAQPYSTVVAGVDGQAYTYADWASTILAWRQDVVQTWTCNLTGVADTEYVLVEFERTLNRYKYNAYYGILEEPHI